jgi:hypothetical protein
MLVASMPAPAFAVDGQKTSEESGITLSLEDFDFGITGRGQPGLWVLVRDVTAATGIVIEQSSDDPTEDRLPLAVYKPLSLKNLRATVRLKLIRGAIQSAGLAFRFTDTDDYYVVSANALEERVDLFRINAGKMEWVGGTDTDVVLSHRHTLGLLVEDDRFAVSLDGKQLFTVTDRTFSSNGRVALWTTEDNVTRFDRLEVEPLPWSEKP